MAGDVKSVNRKWFVNVANKNKSHKKSQDYYRYILFSSILIFLWRSLCSVLLYVLVTCKPPMSYFYKSVKLNLFIFQPFQYFRKTKSITFFCYFIYKKRNPQKVTKNLIFHNSLCINLWQKNIFKMHLLIKVNIRQNPPKYHHKLIFIFWKFLIWGNLSCPKN